MTFAELIQRPVIRLQVRGQKPEPEVFLDPPLQPPGTGDGLRVGVQPHLKQELRRIAGPTVFQVRGFKLAQIQALNGLVQEKNQVIRAEFVLHARR